MAINDAPIEGFSVPNAAASARNFERKFFFAVAVLFPLAVLIGFAPTFYLKPLFNTPPIPRTIVYVHAFFMTAWIALFITQVYLISAKKILVHRKLGFLGVALGIGIIISGLL